mmetsp:Transcript_15103/g.53014  ORF Transcript_15103/g.53014 Transcript_15103/m.53014 type:complete len:213 (-) Transcript_15103:391-1029(-)
MPQPWRAAATSSGVSSSWPCSRRASSRRPPLPRRRSRGRSGEGDLLTPQPDLRHPPPRPRSKPPPRRWACASPSMSPQRRCRRRRSRKCLRCRSPCRKAAPSQFQQGPCSPLLRPRRPRRRRRRACRSSSCPQPRPLSRLPQRPPRPPPSPSPRRCRRRCRGRRAACQALLSRPPGLRPSVRSASSRHCSGATPQRCTGSTRRSAARSSRRC